MQLTPSKYLIFFLLSGKIIVPFIHSALSLILRSCMSKYPKNMAFINNVPNEATQQAEFLNKYPEYDGRGIKIAIIDSDVVDKNLPGMQKTTTGLPKIIDCFGRVAVTVDTTKVVERNGSEYIIGKTDRKLMIPLKWKNPTDKWHLGCVPFWQLYKLTKKYTCKEEQLILFKDEILDCIVWFDGKKWRACIDTFCILNKKETEFSNLENLEILSNFKDNNKEFAYFINQSIFCINIFNDGNSIQFQSPFDDHASTVSQVAAAYFPNHNPEGNGLAPGAQIISFHRRNLEEALLKCIELKVDIVNFSVTFKMIPLVSDTIKKMVEEHGIIITQAATNLGPLYSSIPGAYSDLSDQIFIIGNHFNNPQIGKTKCFENEDYNYSGKGPFLFNGARGIDFVAPGSAIVDYPKWYPYKNLVVKGTSFSAPNAAGAIACLLSALKANKIQYSPGMIKMALANTAFLPKNANKLEFGNGIIQILDAFEFIKKFTNNLPQKLMVPILFDEQKQRGIIFLKNDNTFSKDYYINIDPGLKTKIILKCTSQNGKNFIQFSKTLKNNNSFNVKITNTNSLEDGSINYAEIYGIDSLNPSFGPLFYLPITVICPAQPSFFDNKIITVKPKSPVHYFLKKPSEFQQQCSIKITALNNVQNDESKIILKYRKINYSNLDHFKSNAEHSLEFTQENKVNTVLFNIEHFEEFFEICIFSSDFFALTFKISVEFPSL